VNLINQRPFLSSLVKVHHLRIIEQGWLVQCQYNVTEWGIVFICGMVLQCTGTLKPDKSLNHQLIKADPTLSVVYTYKPVQSIFKISSS